MYGQDPTSNRRISLKDFIEPGRDFFRSQAVQLARGLIGCLLRHDTSEGPVSGVIVETEAYTGDDPASHSFRGRTDRNWPMFEGGGLAYVYMIYGIHNCFNVTAGQPGSGQAVLVRSLQPLQGLAIMQARRGGRPAELLCSGPGRLCEALDIDRRFNGADLMAGELSIMLPGGRPSPEISSSTRIGITRAAELKRRFFLKGSRWVSRRSGT